MDQFNLDDVVALDLKNILQRCEELFRHRDKELTHGRLVKDEDTESFDSLSEADKSIYLSISELAINNIGSLPEPESYEHLIILTFRQSDISYDYGNYRPFLLILPDVLRGILNVTSSGIILNNLHLGTFQEWTEFSVTLYRFKRTDKNERILEQIRGLIETVDFLNDFGPSLYVVESILDHLELIIEDQETIQLYHAYGDAFAYDLSKSPVQYLVFMLKDPGETLSQPLLIKDKRLWDGTSFLSESAGYLLLRIGRQLSQANVRQIIDDLRRRYALQAPTVTDESESENYLRYVEKEREKRRQSTIQNLYSHHRMLIAVTPIAIEAAANLEPILQLNGDLTPRLTSLINEMREQILATYGVRTPGLRVRLNETDMPMGSYLIMIDEIPLVMETVNLEKALCNASVEMLYQIGIKGESATDPENKLEASWIKLKDREHVQHAGYLVWEADEYIIRHLKAVIKRNLCKFVGIQEIYNYFEEEESREFRPDWKDLEAKAGIGRFRTLLLSLLDELLPIQPLTKLLNYYFANSEKPVYEIAESIRCFEEMHSHLLPNLPVSVIELDEYFASFIKENIVQIGDIAILALEPETTQKALSAFRTEVSGLTELNQAVVLVEDWEIRPFVKKLIELEWPEIRVLSRREVQGLKPEELNLVAVVKLDNLL